PSTRVPGRPRALDSIVMKALAKNPLNRYQSAGEMRSDLQRALADQPVSAESVMTDDERTQFIARTPPPPVAVPTREPEPVDHDQERRNGVIWAAIVIALLLVVGAGAFFIWKLGSSSDSSKKIAVPNLVGLTPSAASKTVGNTANCSAVGKCKIDLVQDTNSPTTPGPCDTGETPSTEGVICKVTDTQGQTIPANAEVTQGSQVLYSLYKKDYTTVPYVIGATFQDAATALKQNRLTPKEGKPVDTFDQPKGHVVSATPRYNTKASPGQTVILRLSTGKAKLPDVRKMKEGDARAALNRAQFTNIANDRIRTGPDKAKDGTVVDMDPTPGNAYGPDVRITLTVYRYKAPAPTCDPNKSPATTESSPTTPGVPSGSVSITPSDTPSDTPTNTLPPCGQ
ncbi:MAG: PASTA domain-containing protein, partial [Jatrophihabitantaceae bacterium]